MHYHPLKKTAEMVLLEFLNTRMCLSAADKQNYMKLKKGYEGEVKFAELAEKLRCECLILNGLLLDFNGSKFQIDSILIAQNIIYLNEVKNYVGDFYYENKRFYKSNGTEIKDPLFQLERCTSLLRQLLQSLRINLPIESWVVFINPEFTLYQAPRNSPIIFPTQVNRYVNKLNLIPSKLNGKHHELADKLISLHIEESPFARFPPYDYVQLRKGMTCVMCSSFSISADRKRCVCRDCGHEEEVEAAVLRMVGEHKLLFPGRKITTSGIYEWCNMGIPKRRISSILGKNMKTVGDRRWIFYQ